MFALVKGWSVMGIVSFDVALLCYLVASLEYFVYLAYRKPVVQTLATGTVALGLIFHTLMLGIRSS